MKKLLVPVARLSPDASVDLVYCPSVAARDTVD